HYNYGEIGSNLLKISYFKRDGHVFKLNEDCIQKTNQVRDTDTFIKKHSTLNGIEKRSFALNIDIKKEDEYQKALKKKVETTGPNWYHMPAPKMTPELEQELLAIRYRDSIQGKSKQKDFNSEEELPKYFQ